MSPGMLYRISILCDLLIIDFLFFMKRSGKNELTNSLRRLVISVNITVLSSLFAIILPDKDISLFLQCIHYVNTEWMLIFFMYFLEHYVGNVKSTLATRTTILIYCVVSCISLLLNPVFNHIVDNELVDVKGELLYNFYTKSPGYSIHLCFAYLMVVIIFITLITGLIRTVKLYRKKYFYALIVMSITIALDILCTIMHYIHDFSLYGYVVLVFFMIYFSLYYKPKDIITNTLAYMVADSHTGAICFDPEDKCIYYNEEASQLLLNVNSPDDYEKELKSLLKTKSFRDAKNNKWVQDIQVYDKTLYCEFCFSKLYDEANNYIGCCFSIYDKTEDFAKYRQERYKATHDSLTNLHNREYFYEKVLDIISNNPNNCYYIVCTDIKDFKLVNDIFGYEKGNNILIIFANKLKSSLPSDSVCARLVSDKFAFIIRSDDFEESILRNCIESLQTIINISEFSLHIQAGIYEIQPGDTDVSVMCDKANMAISGIKDNYDVIFAYYNDVLMNKMLQGKYMLSEFDRALENNQFVMYLQPQVDTSGNVMGAEALVRWIHPEKGMISPGEFIPVFEKSGIIHKLDMFIWEKAACTLKQWKDIGIEDKHISVNISAKDFYYLDLFKVFTKLVEQYGISPSNLKLEITESALMQDIEKQLEMLTRLREYGFSIEIDDFGSGYSSLNMLKDIKADVLKIDMGFLREIDDNERARVILAMIINLAKQLKMTVVTEGVELLSQVNYLTELGCDMFQGFYFSRPVSVVEYENKYICPQ